MQDRLVEVHELKRVFQPARRLFQRQGGSASVALDGVSFAIGAGECLALVGPNGAGKSTLLRILATLLTPSGGRAAVCGHDVTRASAQVRACIGYAGDADRSFFWPLTGHENLVFFGRLAGLSAAEAGERAAHWLARVGLDDAGDRRVAGYSAGMRRRLGLARALLHEPRVVLLDEPTANLDAEYRDVTIELTRELTAAGRAGIVATHDAGLVAATASDVLRMEAGRVVGRRRGGEPVTYRLRLADGGTIEIEDLGDGHALAMTLSELIAEGRDVETVERVGSRVASP